MEEVIKSYFLPLSQARQWPENQVGLLGYHLGKLGASEVKVAPGFLVPKDTLLQIARDNHLDHQLQTLLTNRAALGEAGSRAPLNLQPIFTRLKISPSISEQYFTAFYQTTPRQKVSVVASWITQRHGHLFVLSDPVQGDANVFQTILHIWAQTVELTLDPTRPDYSLDALVPAALLIQAHLEPQLAGHILTKSPHTSVYELVIQLPTKLKLSNPSAQFLIDVRTWQIVSSQLPTGLSQRKLEAYISLSQMLEIAQVAYRVKLHELHQLQISWEIVQGDVYISNVERLPELGERATTLSLTEVGTLLVGTPMVTGIATNSAKVVFHPLSERQIFEQEILVTRDLERLTLNNLIGLRGVICESVPSWQAQQLLNQHHIPCLGRVRGATEKLRTGQVITLNTKLGKVFTEQSSVTNPRSLFSPKTSHRLVAVAHQTWDENEYPDIPSHNLIFQPEAHWLATGVHPLHLLRTHHSQGLKNELLRSLTSYRPLQQPILYRPATLRTDQLLKLGYGASYEVPEANPVLGFTGAVRLLHQPELLHFELEVLKQAQQSLPHQLGVLLPSPRHVGEIEQVITHFTKLKLSNLWVEVSHPAALFQLSDWPLKKIEYIVIRTQTLLALAQGLDPYYPDLLALYPHNEALLKDMLRQIIKQVSPKQIILEVHQEFQSTTRLAIELGITGIMANLSDMQTVHHLVESAEHQRFSFGK